MYICVGDEDGSPASHLNLLFDLFPPHLCGVKQCGSGAGDPRIVQREGCASALWGSIQPPIFLPPKLGWKWKGELFHAFKWAV